LTTTYQALHTISRLSSLLDIVYRKNLTFAPLARASDTRFAGNLPAPMGRVVFAKNKSSVNFPALSASCKGTPWKTTLARLGREPVFSDDIPI
jgi:hypothetical protein